MVEVGQVHLYERRFEEADIDVFAELSGDHGRHHMERDSAGRRVVHGLLVIAVATRIGADLHYVAHRMEWMFTRPVFAGDTVVAEVGIVKVERQEGRAAVSLSVRIRNQDGKVVVRGESDGVVLDEGSELRS
jgi:3-hydroxybutyryl-CoA dehydratase